MKRMVKNGDLIDVEPDGTITVAGKPIRGGGGGGSSDRELTLIMPYPSNSSATGKKLYIDDDETWSKINNLYYETIKVNYEDGKPLAVFHTLNINDNSSGISSFSLAKTYACYYYYSSDDTTTTWFGEQNDFRTFAALLTNVDNKGNYLSVGRVNRQLIPILDKSKFDALYKLADKPTQDGTYVLKATVSGGAVTYTWVAQ